MFTLVKRTDENADSGTFTVIQNRLIKIRDCLSSAMNNEIFKVNLTFVTISTVLIALDGKSWLKVSSSSSSSSPSKKSLCRMYYSGEGQWAVIIRITFI